MKLQSLEERVAATPAAVICDECVHSDICRWIGDMKAAVVETDRMCKDKPFMAIDWGCNHFSEEVHPRG